jgi:NCAIR mutase (PurE)-related protein
LRVEEILERLLAGEFSVEEALRLIESQRVEVVEGLARLDPERLRRKGVPEVVYAPGKTPELTAELAGRLLGASGVALVSRCADEHRVSLEDLASRESMQFERFGSGVRLRVTTTTPATAGEHAGKIGLLAAGTSDIDVAEEARMVAETMGCRVLRFYDVGVAALHRLVEPLRNIVAADIDVIVVAAGMEGALPSVVAGLVAVPVIALPISTGYGAGGRGLAALLATLQSCSPGVVVVNIDNGIGAGAAAALIANRAAAMRARTFAAPDAQRA